jgi:hypothetical protein
MLIRGASMDVLSRTRIRKKREEKKEELFKKG